MDKHKLSQKLLVNEDWLRIVSVGCNLKKLSKACNRYLLKMLNLLVMWKWPARLLFKQLNIVISAAILLQGLSMRYKFMMTNGQPGDYWHEHFSADEFCEWVIRTVQGIQYLCCFFWVGSFYCIMCSNSQPEWNWQSHVILLQP